MGIEISNPGGGGITIEVDPNSLPLTGGTVTGNTTFGSVEVPVDVNITGGLTVNNATTTYIGDGVQVTDAGGSAEVYAGWLEMNLADTATLSNLTHTQLRFEDGVTDITIDATGVKFPNPYFNSGLFRGSFDSGRNSYNGISLVCTQGIELNWQAGYLKALNGSSVVPINVESDIVNTSLPDGDGLYDSTSLVSGGIHVSNNTDGFVSLNLGSVGGTTNGGPNWGLGVDGCGGDNDDDLSWGIGPSYSAGNYRNENWWDIGFGGIEVGKVDDITNPQLYYNNNTASLTVQTDEPPTGEFNTLTNRNSSILAPAGVSVNYRNEYDENASISMSGSGIIKTGNLGGNFTLNGTQVLFEDSGTYFHETGFEIKEEGQSFISATNDHWIQIIGFDSTSLTLGHTQDGSGTTGITFGDSSVQHTKGDRYKATSTTSNTVDNGNGKTFDTQTWLAYTPYCKVLIVNTGTSNRMYCTVVSYDETTGVLVVDADTHAGSGTHTDWTINIGG